jgi:two-component system, OmpR family, response regulator
MVKRPENLLKISEVAKEAGVLPSTVRYYTDIGIISVKSETKGGHRLYDRDSTVNKIRKIQFLNQQGKSIEDIKTEILNANRKKILVVDDEPEVGSLVTEVVKQYYPDFEVRVVYDGFSAGKMLSEYLPDLIILDLMLPGLNGFEVCKQIRSNQFMSGVKILAVSGFDSEENKKKILANGANDYLSKPMNVSALKEKIATLIA